MREILFRGKQVDNGHWVYGTPVTLKNSETYINFEFCGWIDRTLVYPDTVGQYTGLKDKNDKRIFEGAGNILQTAVIRSFIHDFLCPRGDSTEAKTNGNQGESFIHTHFTK